MDVIAKDYAESSLTVKQIAHRHGVSVATVIAHARRAGLERRRRATQSLPVLGTIRLVSRPGNKE